MRVPPRNVNDVYLREGSIMNFFFDGRCGIWSSCTQYLVKSEVGSSCFAHCTERFMCWTIKWSIVVRNSL